MSKSPEQSPNLAAHSQVEAGESKHLQALRRKQRLSSIFTIFCSGAALVSDGLQNNIFVRRLPSLRRCRRRRCPIFSFPPKNAF
jgi:hypothetical protein